jgi:ribosome-binding factor A
MGSVKLETHRQRQDMKIPKSKRARRVGVEIQKIVAETVRREAVSVASGAIVSIPEVRVSDDLRHANLYCSIHGAEDPQAIQVHLLRLLPKLRRQVAQSLRIRKIPEMRLIWDETFEQADKLERLFRKIEEESASTGSDDEDAGGEENSEEADER